MNELTKKEFFEQLILLRNDFKLAKSIAFANEEWLSSSTSAELDKKTEWIFQKGILELRVPRKQLWREFIYYIQTGKIQNE